jgi:hypothetical protein
MSKPRILGLGLVILSLASCAPMVSAEKLDATVLYRQNSDTDYNALVPGYSGTIDCAADLGNPECYDTSRAAAVPGELSLNVVGTTLSLKLPDGKVAVLNCVNKYSYKGTALNRRSCGMPLVEHVQAEFKGDIARLEWLVSQDGRKTESETYKVLALLDKR